MSSVLRRFANLQIGSKVFARCPGAGLDGVLFTVVAIERWGVKGRRTIPGRYIEANIAWDNVDPLDKPLEGGLGP